MNKKEFREQDFGPLTLTDDEMLRRGAFYIPPPANLFLTTGDLTFPIHAKRTIRNRIKYWLFCQFFPFERRWEK